MRDGYVSANAAAKGAPPQWDEAGRVHDWRNHVPADVRRIWHTFSREQLAVIAAWAEDLAMDEKWE